MGKTELLSKVSYIYRMSQKLQLLTDKKSMQEIKECAKEIENKSIELLNLL